MGSGSKKLNMYYCQIRSALPKQNVLKKMYIEIDTMFSKEISPLWRSSRKMSKKY